MDHMSQRNEADFYSSSQQSNLMHTMPEFSMQNRASITIPTSSTPSSRSSRLPKSPAEEWKKSSSSSSDNGWKTNSSSSTSANKMESWKMSGRPRHAQLAQVQDEDPRLRRQSAPIFNSPSWQNPKPLPVEPTPLLHHQSYPIENTHYTTQAPPFHITTPMQQPAFIHPPAPPPQEFYPPPMEHYASYPPPTQDFNAQPYPPHMSYPPQQQQFHPQPYPPTNVYNQDHVEYPPTNVYNQDHIEYPPTSTYNHQPDHSIEPVTLHDAPLAPKTPEKTPVTTNTKKKESKPEKKVRQITVQSINAEHRVWIDVLPSETGLSLAEKIHIIATFRTRKIVSIETKSGRKVPLDNRPVFGSWMDMESFEDGERWAVEWRENDRGVVDRFMSKIVQAGGGKRKDHVVKEKD